MCEAPLGEKKDTKKPCVKLGRAVKKVVYLNTILSSLHAVFNISITHSLERNLRAAILIEWRCI